MIRFRSVNSAIRTGSTVAGDGFSDDLLLDFGIGLSRFGALVPRDAEGKDQDCIATTAHFHSGAEEFGVRLVPSRRD